MPGDVTNPRQGSTWFTPLAIIAAFVTLTETVLGIGLTQVSGGVQVALTVFVIAFPTLVALAFFIILWSRPYVFYSPAEFGGTDPKHFAEAMRGRLPDSVAKQIAEVEANPKDEIAKFQLMESLIEVATRQHLILMKLKGVTFPLSTYGYLRYETGTPKKGWQSGIVEGSDIYKKLAGTGLVEIEPSGPSVKLTAFGHKYVDWLISNGKQNEFYESPLGGWGTRQNMDGPFGMAVEALSKPTAATMRPADSTTKSADESVVPQSEASPQPEQVPPKQ